MKTFSSEEIRHITSRAEAAWKHNRLPESKKRNFLLTLGAYLSQASIFEDVCLFCLGTGRANGGEKK